MRARDGLEWWHPSTDDDGPHDLVTEAERSVLDAARADSTQGSQQ